ncbi:LysR substrate-binding domain-containing protein [Streptomyces niveus]|uniref:LysR substrate-binding domain-containing protein n=1 Tax=Streptomyces niveus TaxID=193462 RepID=UPI0033D6D9DA
MGGLLAMLESREIQLALLWDYHWRRVDDPSLTVTHLIVARDHRLAGRESVDITELTDENWITRADEHPVADVLARTCQAAGFRPTVSFHAHDYQEAQAMVSIGLALAPRPALTSLLSGIEAVSLRPSAPTRRILLARLTERRPTPAESAAEELFREVSRDIEKGYER